MKKNIYKRSGRLFLLLTLVMFTTLSCSEEFLELQPQQAVSMAQALESKTDFDAAIIGCYDALQSSPSYGKYFILVTDVMSDDLKGNAVINRLSDWHSYLGTDADRVNLAYNLWARYYQIVDRANRILEAETDLELDEIYGQAYAFRALAHFDLVRIYGQHYTYTSGASHMGVPIVTTVDPFQTPARNTVAEVYEQVIADFETAMDLLDADDNSFYFSDNVIKALLSRVYLYMEDWASAESMADDVIGSGAYSLVANADYPSIFSGDHSAETIFEVNMNPTDNLGGGSLAANYLSTGYNEYLPTYDLYDAFEDGDIRKETMIVVDSTIGGGDYGYIRANKFVDVLGYENSPVVRLSELYLIRAEANYHLNTAASITAAQADVTMIRQRGMATAPAVSETGQALLDEILLERRRELCFEGHRLWDLTRNMLGVYRTDCTSSACSIDYPNDGFILAIGLQELEVNENIVQNPGY